MTGRAADIVLSNGKIVTVDDEVAEMQTDAEDDAAVLGLVAVCLKHRLLELDGGPQGVNGAGELGEGTVAGEFDKAATVARKGGFEALGAVGLQSREGAALVAAHHAGVSDRVGDKDRG